MGVGSNWTPCSSRLEQMSVLRVGAGCGGRLFSAKLGIITHDCMHQVFDHLLPDHAILLTCQLSDRLRDRVNDFICFSGIDFV